MSSRLLLPSSLLLALTGGLLSAHDPITTKLSWSKEISRIFANRCIGCHQPGGGAPFSLTSYEEARPWAVAIRDEVTARRMPPWNAVRGFGRFSADPSLSQEELQWIVEWVNGGAPPGDPRFLDPSLPRLPAPPARPPGPPLRASDLLPMPAGSVAALRVLSLPANTEARLLLQHPDGRLQPLAWLRPISPHAPSLYSFAQPVSVPRGSRLRLWAPPAVHLELFSSPSPNRPSVPE